MTIPTWQSEYLDALKILYPHRQSHFLVGRNGWYQIKDHGDPFKGRGILGGYQHYRKKDILKMTEILKERIAKWDTVTKAT